jgi:hypothetical protein
MVTRVGGGSDLHVYGCQLYRWLRMQHGGLSVGKTPICLDFEQAVSLQEAYHRAVRVLRAFRTGSNFMGETGRP